MAQLVARQKRRCGYEKKGGVYLKTGTRTSEEGVVPLFVKINPPVPNPGPFSRGSIIVDGDAILNNQPYEDWLAGSSKERLQRQQGDEWALDVFGMTASRRLSLGECAGVESIEFAIGHLIGKVSWSHRLSEYFQRLAKLDVPGMPRAAGPYSKMLKNAQDYTRTRRVDHLIGLVAATWLLADRIPPRKRDGVIPILVSILVLMNLNKDALAMRKEYR